MLIDVGVSCEHLDAETINKSVSINTRFTITSE
jgi:hypothetical protein